MSVEATVAACPPSRQRGWSSAGEAGGGASSSSWMAALALVLACCRRCCSSWTWFWTWPWTWRQYLHLPLRHRHRHRTGLCHSFFYQCHCHHCHYRRCFYYRHPCRASWPAEETASRPISPPCSLSRRRHPPKPTQEPGVLVRSLWQVTIGVAAHRRSTTVAVKRRSGDARRGAVRGFPFVFFNSCRTRLDPSSPISHRPANPADRIQFGR